MKSSGGFECWYVGFGWEILQHMQVFCSRDAVKKKGEGLFSITILCCTYVFATESSSSCSWRKRRCRMCLQAAPRKKKQHSVIKTCQQESNWKKTETLKPNMMQEAVQSTTCQNVIKWEVRQFVGWIFICKQIQSITHTFYQTKIGQISPFTS